MARIQLLAWDNRRGLTHDMELLAGSLTELGHSVDLTPLGPRRHDGRWRSLCMRARMLRQRLATGESSTHLYDVNIALEHVRPPFFDLARLNVLVPNPEWLSPHSQRYLGRFDAILCKTEHARALFDAEGYPTICIGFDSQDSHRPQVRKQRRFLHLAGASPMKGTRRLVALWEQHPEWPALLVLQSDHEPIVPPHSEYANIEIHSGFIEDAEELRQLQNEHAFHVCLSETEGWGHYIAEAMSCGAVVVTCDAPPMNELVRPDRGVLVAATRSRRFNMAQLYTFDEAALEAAVDRVTAMADDEIAAIGARARQWFEDNRRSFAGRVDEALRALL
jgi:glycosyltransferase involved in cell wall biosynthesis